MAERILTVPEVIARPAGHLPTGNEYVAIPALSARDGSIAGINVLHLGARGLLEYDGDGEPFLRPVVALGSPDGRRVELRDRLVWSRLEHWLPRFELGAAELAVTGTVFAPLGCKGLVYALEVRNQGAAPVEAWVGLEGRWARTLQTVYTSRPVAAAQHAFRSRWAGGLALEARVGTALLAVAIGASEELDTLAWEPAQGISFRLGKVVRLAPGEGRALAFYVAVNLEADGADAVLVDLRRRGWRELLDQTRGWLRERILDHPDSRLGELLNRNLFFNYFYALGNTIDTEEGVLVTSRSPEYYVSAAFWSRDALLWSFPAVLLADRRRAREVLLAAFGRYARHPGAHSQYLDGTVLYPGFELDQLAAYPLALDRYLRTTRDESVLGEPAVRRGLERIEAALREQKHPEAQLYATFLDPSDDPVRYPCLTYDNALAARACEVLAYVRDAWGDQEKSENWREAARLTRLAIREHCVIEGPLGPMFAWSVDLRGNAEIYDDPPGSLQLLPYYGYCSAADPVYRNTVRWVHSEHNPYYCARGRFRGAGCAHAAQPWPMDAVNRILAGDAEEGLEFLRQAEMDGGLACESVDPETGEIRTGAAFATFAGFLAYAIYRSRQGGEEGAG